jgi:hypothetical protein
VRHGKTEAKYLSAGKLAGQKFTSVKSSGWKNLKLTSLDLTENFLNFDKIEVLAPELEILEFPFNEIRLLKIIDIHKFKNLRFLDLRKRSK